MFWVFKKTVEGTLNVAKKPIYNYLMAVIFMPVIGYFYLTFM